MPDYVWICLNMRDYAGICVNMPRSVWMAFVLHFSCGYITLHVVTYSETKVYSLKEHQTVFFKI